MRRTWSNRVMRIEFDRDAGAGYIYVAGEVGPGSAVENLVVERGGKGDIVLDFDEHGRLLGIEIIGARELLGRDVLAGLEAI